MGHRNHLGASGTATLQLDGCHLQEQDEVVTVTGKLEPLGSVRSIQLPMGGIASDILVKDGEELRRAGADEVDAEATKQRLKSLKKATSLKQFNLSSKKQN